MSEESQVLTLSSVGGLAYVAVIGLLANMSAKVYLPKTAKWQDKFTWFWMVRTFLPVFTTFSDHRLQAFDGMIHCSFEAAFLYLSVFGRQVSTSHGIVAEIGMARFLLQRAV